MILLNLNLNFRFSKRYFKSPIGPKRRLRILKSKIREHQPGIITFQEATDILILTQLKRALKNYRFVYYIGCKPNTPCFHARG